MMQPVYTAVEFPDDINLVWSDIDKMTEVEFESYLIKLQSFIVESYDKFKRPIMAGQKTESEIASNLQAFIDLPIEHTLLYIKDKYGIQNGTKFEGRELKVLFNYNKFGNVVNHWFPEIMDTKIARNLTDKNPKSVIDNVRDFTFFKRNMTAVLKNDRMHIFKHAKNERIFPKVNMAIKLGSGTQPATNFPTIIAKWLYQYHLNSIKIDESERYYVLDPSMGWGGRLCGLMGASYNVHHNITLIGTDVNTDVHHRFQMFYDYWIKNVHRDLSSLCDYPGADKLELIKFTDPAEELNLNSTFQSYCGKGHLAFTSPPYFNRENYSEDDNQSFKKYGDNYSSWRDGFLDKMIHNVSLFLKKDGIFILNIADIKVGKNKYFPLEQDSVDSAVRHGLEYVDKYYFLLSPIIGDNTAKNFIEIDDRTIGGNNVIQTYDLDDNLIDNSECESVAKSSVSKYKYEPMFVFKKL